MIRTLEISDFPTEGSLADDVWDADVLLALISAERGRDRFGQVFLNDMLADPQSVTALGKSDPGTQDSKDSPLFMDEWDAVAYSDETLTCQHAGEFYGESYNTGPCDMLTDLVSWARSLSPVTDAAAT